MSKKYHLSKYFSYFCFYLNLNNSVFSGSGVLITLKFANQQNFHEILPAKHFTTEEKRFFIHITNVQNVKK